MSASVAPRFRAEGDTDTGQVRGNNEDCFAIVAGPNGDFQLWVVADGMGGGVKGEVASRLAVDTLAEFMTTDSWVDPVAALREGFRRANAAVFARGTGGGEATRSVMGTTLVAVLIEEAAGHYWLANCGDSRAYLLGGAGLEQISQDHSLVAERVRAGEMTPEQARVADERNIVTRAIGIEREVRTDVREVGVLATGERVLLCSDGLHGMITDEEIAAIAGAGTMESAVRLLIESANAAGGRDNITVLIGSRSEAAALPWDATVVERRAAVPVVPPAVRPTGAASWRKWRPRSRRRWAAAGAGVVGLVLASAALVVFAGGNDHGATPLGTPTPAPTATSGVAATATPLAATPTGSPTEGMPTATGAVNAISDCSGKAQITTKDNTFSAISAACALKSKISPTDLATFNEGLCYAMKSERLNQGLIREEPPGSANNQCGFVAGDALLTLPDKLWFEMWSRMGKEAQQ